MQVSFVRLKEVGAFARDKLGKLTLDLNILKEADYSSYDKFLNNPKEVISELTKEVKELFNINGFKIINFNDFIPLSELRVESIDRLCLLKGMITKATKVIAYVESSVWECKHCSETVVSKRNVPPLRCVCGGKHFNLIQNHLRDLQEIEIEEPQDEMEGKQPQKIRVRLFDDLTNKEFSGILQPGNKICALGINEKLEVQKKGSEDALFEYRLLALEINSLEEQFNDEAISEEDEEQIKEISMNNPLDVLTENLAPPVFGNDIIKKALVLQMVGGVKKMRAWKVFSRNRTNILLVGDPGVAKTLLGKCVLERMPKSVYISGDATTKAGLIGIVDKDPLLNTWCVKVGSLSKANDSIAIIDELDKLKPEDRESLHTPMESGEIILNKADVHCYSEDTEVLTEKGWKKYDEVKNLKIFQYNYNNDCMELVDNGGLSLFEYNGNMFHFKNKRNDILVTPNHRMFLKPSNNKCKYRIIRAEDIKHKRFNFINASSYNDGQHHKFFVLKGTKLNIKRKDEKYVNQTKDKKIPMDTWLEFLGYFLSEGGLNYESIKGEKKYYITLGQNIGDNQKKIELCLNKLSQYGLKFCRIVEKKNKMEYHIRYSIGNKQLWDYLFNNCMYKNNQAKKYHKYHKKIPEFIFELNRKQIKILFDSMMLGDGTYKNEKPKCYYSTSEKLMDGFQFICSLLGKSSKKNYRLGRYRNGYYENKIYYLSISDKKTPEFKLKQLKKVKYKGKVFCFSVPSGVFFTRRGGCISIQGNTRLNANCSVLGIANPKNGMFDLGIPFATQIDIPAPLMTRFDIIFVMTDNINKDYDYSVMNSIYDNKKKEKEKESTISVDLFRKYITYVRKLKPTLPPIHRDYVSELYHSVRMKTKNLNGGVKGIPISARFGEGVIRLAEASAKIRMSKTVEREDIDIAKEILLYSLDKLGMDTTGGLDMGRLGYGKSLSKKMKGKVIIELIKRELEKLKTTYIYNNYLKEKCVDNGISELEYEDLIYELNKEGEILKKDKGWGLPN